MMCFFCLKAIEKLKSELFQNYNYWYDIVAHIAFIREICQMYESCHIFKYRVSVELDALNSTITDYINEKIEDLCGHFDEDKYLWLEKFENTSLFETEFIDIILPKCEMRCHLLVDHLKKEYSSDSQLKEEFSNLFKDMLCFLDNFSVITNYHQNSPYKFQKCMQYTNFLGLTLTSCLVELFDYVSEFITIKFDIFPFISLLLHTDKFLKENNTIKKCYHHKINEKLYLIISQYAKLSLKYKIEQLCKALEQEKWNITQAYLPISDITSIAFFDDLLNSIYSHNSQYEDVKCFILRCLDDFMPSQSIPPKYREYFNQFQNVSCAFGNTSLMHLVDLFLLLIVGKNFSHNNAKDCEDVPLLCVIQFLSAFYLMIYRQFELKNHKLPSYFQNVDFKCFHDRSKSEITHISTMCHIKLKEILSSGNISTIRNHLYLIVPIGSLNSIMKVMVAIKFRVNSEKHTATIDEFFSLTRDIYDFMCVIIASRAIKYKNVLEEILETKFDLKSQKMDHSFYVNTIMGQVKDFNEHLNTFQSEIHADSSNFNDIWRYVTLFLSNTIVEGYTTVTKCSQAGRDLMQLDYQQIMINLDSIYPFKKMIIRGYVEDAIRCFYFPEDTFDQFINDPLTQSRYSENQLKSMSKLIHKKSSKIKKKINKIFT